MNWVVASPTRPGFGRMLVIGVVGYSPITEFGRNLVIGLWVLPGNWEGGGFGKNFGKFGMWVLVGDRKSGGFQDNSW